MRVNPEALPRRGSFLRGWALASLFVGGWALVAFNAVGSADFQEGEARCLHPVQIKTGALSRLGCAAELRGTPCAGAQGGDLVWVEETGCRLEPGAMDAGVRLGAALPLDLNRASARDLQLLPGVGPTLSKAVVSHRAVSGRFESVEGLSDVVGVGAKTLKRLRSFLTVGRLKE